MNWFKQVLAENHICSIDEDLGDDVEIDITNFYVPDDSDYTDFEDDVEEVELDYISEKLNAQFKYKDPETGEIFLYNNKGIYHRDGKTLLFVSKAADKKKVKLNKPFRTPKGPKKFSVYVKNDKGNIVKVNFGDPNYRVRKNDPVRRKSFRARHNCDNPGPKWKARYWSCKWSW